MFSLAADHYTCAADTLHPVSQVAIFLGVVCSVVAGLGGRVADMVLGLVSMIIILVARDAQGAIDDRRAEMLRHVPQNVRAALSQFNLDGKTTVYAVCPACHYTYAPTDELGSFQPVYPERCQNMPHPGGGVCGEPLLEPRSSSSSPYKPLKTFVYQHFHDYLAGLLSQPDVERAMDKACDDFAASVHQPPADYTRTVFDGKFFSTFYHDEAQNKLFLVRPNGEGRYAFALFIDFFSAEGKSLHNAHASLGIIAMACLNLPADIRYKPENIYLAGIVPGPEEPKLELLNHYQAPLISDMCQSWTDGVFISRTALCPHGRMTRSAIAVGVFDLPAGRKAAALAGHSADWFCSICDLHGRVHLSRTDCNVWTRRDPRQMRHWAEQWRDASSIADRDNIFRRHGVRWSELWRLPYWDPTRMMVVDAMHCLYEGLIKMHCRVALDLSVTKANVAEPEIPAFSWPFTAPSAEVAEVWSQNDLKGVSQIHNLLVQPINGPDDDARAQAFTVLQDRLRRKNMRSLTFVCADLGCTPGGAKPPKNSYVAALLEWRKGRPLINPNPRLPRIVTPVVIERIRVVMRDMVKPSWLDSLPSDLHILFGSKGAGSFKADEWRTFFTVYLPVALTSLWGEGTEHASQEASNYFLSLLDHTMSLVCAVLVAGSRLMSNSRATKYRDYIQYYNAELHKLYPHVEPRTNQHVAFHISDFLLLYGPVRSWWCFPFERLIGVLQNLPSNHKFGEFSNFLRVPFLIPLLGQMEGSLLQSFIAASKLRRWLARPDAPHFIKECKLLFDKAFGASHKESAILDDAATARKKLSETPPDLQLLVAAPQVSLRAHVHHAGRTYSRSSTHLGNSLLLYYPGGDPTAPVRAGSIKYIYADGATVHLAVNAQVSVPAGTRNPYERYPDFHASLYSTSLNAELEVVELSWIVGHYARWTMNDDLCVVIALLQVSNIFSSCVNKLLSRPAHRIRASGTTIKKSDDQWARLRALPGDDRPTQRS